MGKVISKKELTKHVELIRTDSGEAYFRWYGQDIITTKDFKEQFKYRYRVRKHKITQSVIKSIVKHIALYLAKSDKRDKTNLLCPDLVVEYNINGYSYISKYENRKYYYKLRYRDLTVFGYNEYDCYLEFIKKVIIVPCCFPYC